MTQDPGPDADAGTGPRTEMERAVAAAWSVVLECKDIARDVSFFALGAESVHIASMARLLRESVEPDLPLRALFMAPTIEGMAAAIEQFQMETAMRRPPGAGAGPQQRESGSV